MAIDIILHPLFLGVLGGAIFGALNYARLYRSEYDISVKSFIFPLMTGIACALGYIVFPNMPIPAAAVASIVPLGLTIDYDKVSQKIKTVWQYLPVYDQPQDIVITQPEIIPVDEIERWEKEKAEILRGLNLLFTVCHKQCMDGVACVYYNEALSVKCGILSSFGAFGKQNEITSAVESVVNRVLTQTFQPYWRKMLNQIEAVNRLNTLKWRLILSGVQAGTYATITTIIAYLVLYIPILASLI
jgi:hypothetical protein